MEKFGYILLRMWIVMIHKIIASFNFWPIKSGPTTKEYTSFNHCVVTTAVFAFTLFPALEHMLNDV